MKKEHPLSFVMRAITDSFVTRVRHAFRFSRDKPNPALRGEMTVAPDLTSSNGRKAARNRMMLDQHRNNTSYAALAHIHKLSVSRIKVIVAREATQVEREAELALADTLPDQPNPLHLSFATRTFVAEAVGRDEFTREDVLGLEGGMATLLRMPGFRGVYEREVRAWLDRYQ